MRPILLDWGPFMVYSYPFFIGLAFGAYYSLFNYFYYQSNENIILKKFIFWPGLFLSIYLGAKLFFIATRMLDGSIDFYLQTSFWLGGGLVWYGALIFGQIFVFLFLKLTRPLESVDNWQNFFSICVLPIPLAHSIGRVGCFLAGCCFGAPISGWPGVYMHQALRHPVQLYESLYLIILFFFLIMLKSKWNLAPLKVIGYYYLLYGGGRFVLEFFRGDLIRGKFLFFYVSQWISCVIVILATIHLIRSMRRGQSI